MRATERGGFERVVRGEGDAVTGAVRLTGTHTVYLDDPVDEVPTLAATGRTIDLPDELFTYCVGGDRISRVFGESPEGAGPPAPKRRPGTEERTAPSRARRSRSISMAEQTRMQGSARLRAHRTRSPAVASERVQDPGARPIPNPSRE